MIHRERKLEASVQIRPLYVHEYEIQALLLCKQENGNLDVIKLSQLWNSFIIMLSSAKFCFNFTTKNILWPTLCTYQCNGRQLNIQATFDILCAQPDYF